MSDFRVRMYADSLRRYTSYRTFGLQISAENTGIMGLSMGGFGAIHTALAYPDRFWKIGAMSSALIVHEVAGMTNVLRYRRWSVGNQQGLRPVSYQPRGGSHIPGDKRIPRYGLLE